MLGAELGAQPPYVHVDRTGAAEVVVAPDLLEELGAREDAAGVLREVLQELELLEGEVEDAALELGGVRRLVDRQVAVADLHRGVVADDLLAAHGQPQPGLDLGGAGGVEQDVVDAPVGGDGGEAALRDDEDERAAGAGRAEQLTQAADLRQVAAAVDEDDVGAGGVDEGGALRGGHPHVVQEQAEGGEHLRRRLEGIGQEQQRTHTSGSSSVPARTSVGTALGSAIPKARTPAVSRLVYNASESTKGPGGYAARVLCPAE
ncbi:hypothetical protein SVIOM74S_04006 [Streptomyces violarus]